MLDKNKMITTFIFILMVGAIFYPHLLFAATANQTVHDVPQDTMTPTVSIAFPANGVAVSGAITVSASASDNVGVAGVQFQLDGTNLGAEGIASPYEITLDTTTLTNGAHTLSATAKDTAGNITTSSAVTITVNNLPPDTTPPTGAVSINSDAVYSNSTAVTLTLSVIDTDSGMGGGAEMQFSNDNINWSTPGDYVTTKAWTLTNGDGLKTVYAKYKDVAGNWSEAVSDTIILDTQAPSAPRNITVR